MEAEWTVYSFKRNFKLNRFWFLSYPFLWFQQKRNVLPPKCLGHFVLWFWTYLCTLRETSEFSKPLIPWRNLSPKQITKTSLLPRWAAPSVGAGRRRCQAPSPPVIPALMVCSRRGRWSGMKGWLMRNHTALLLGPPAYLLLRTRLAWTRLIPTVYHLSKYVIHLGVAKTSTPR